MADLQKQQAMFASLATEEKRQHLVKMLEPIRGHLEVLDLVYDYVFSADASVSDDVYQSIYDRLLDFMLSLHRKDAEDHHEKLKDMLKYINEQSAADQAAADDILNGVI